MVIFASNLGKSIYIHLAFNNISFWRIKIIPQKKDRIANLQRNLKWTKNWRKKTRLLNSMELRIKTAIFVIVAPQNPLLKLSNSHFNLQAIWIITKTTTATTEKKRNRTKTANLCFYSPLGERCHDHSECGTVKKMCIDYRCWIEPIAVINGLKKIHRS